MLRLETDVSKEKFLGAMMHWCFKFGCEVTLRNQALYTAPMDPTRDPHAMGEFHEIQRNGSIVDMAHRTKHKVIEIPEITFRKGDRYVSICAHSWEDLMRRFEYEYKRIFMELNVPMFNPEEVGK